MKFTDIAQDMILNRTKYINTSFPYIKYWYFNEEYDLIAIYMNGELKCNLLFR